MSDLEILIVIIMFAGIAGANHGLFVDSWIQLVMSSKSVTDSLPSAKASDEVTDRRISTIGTSDDLKTMADDAINSDAESYINM